VGKMLSKKLYWSNSSTMMYWCPGCQMRHPVYIAKPEHNPDQDVWTWNGDVEKPTFYPSLNISLGPEKRCHFFIRDGMIIYMGDSTHELKNQTVELPDIPIRERDYP